MEPPKNKTALIAGVAAAATVTAAALAMAVWPALTRPEPPAEAAGDDGLRIRLVEPPRALLAQGGPLDVGLSEAAQAMAKGREALFVRTPPVRPPPPPARRAPSQLARVDDEDDLAPPPEPAPEPVDDRWDRDAWRRDRFEAARQRRWEEEQRWARQEREERAAWEEARARDRYEDRRDEDRYAPPPQPEEDRPPPGW